MLWGRGQVKGDRQSSLGHGRSSLPAAPLHVSCLGMRPKGERKGSSGKAENASWPPSKRVLRRLIEDATVDAYGESEQRTGLFTMMEEHLALPFETEVLGVTVSVVRIDLNLADEIVVICRRGNKRQSLPILDLPLPKPPPAGAEWIEAYRLWTRGA